jgi:hypothetical protein
MMNLISISLKNLPKLLEFLANFVTLLDWLIEVMKQLF